MKYYASAIKEDATLGCKADWYIQENASLLTEKNYLGRLVGYFAEVKWHDKMADFSSNGWEHDIVAGPFPTKEEALEAARAYCKKEQLEYTDWHWK